MQCNVQLAQCHDEIFQALCLACLTQGRVTSQAHAPLPLDLVAAHVTQVGKKTWARGSYAKIAMHSSIMLNHVESFFQIFAMIDLLDDVGRKNRFKCFWFLHCLWLFGLFVVFSGVVQIVYAGGHPAFWCNKHCNHHCSHHYTYNYIITHHLITVTGGLGLYSTFLFFNVVYIIYLYIYRPICRVLIVDPSWWSTVLGQISNDFDFPRPPKDKMHILWTPILVCWFWFGVKNVFNSFQTLLFGGASNMVAAEWHFNIDQYRPTPAWWLDSNVSDQ